MRKKIETIDLRLIRFLNLHKIALSRFAIFLVYFWFGFLKLIGESPATPIAEALVSKIGLSQYFDNLFILLAAMEVLIGVLFLFPKAIRIVFPLLVIHLITVCSPLILVPELSWNGFLVPTLEGQYIIKNVLIAALAVAVAANTKPIAAKR